MQGLAKVKPEYGKLELIETNPPNPRPDEAVVRVAHAGVCGSDVGVYTFKEAYHSIEFPRILGHEYSGTIVDIGSHVELLELGDRVVERPVRSCGECFQCRTSFENVCQDAVVTGNHHHGAFAEYIAAPENALHRLPDGLSLKQAVITEPMSVAVRAVQQNSRVSLGDDVLVEGPGPIGILTALLASERGGNVTVAGLERDRAYRLPLASELGLSTTTVETSSGNHTDFMEKNPSRFDVVFDATGHPSGLKLAMTTVRRGGQIVIVGIPGSTELDVTELVRSELDVQCSYGSVWEDFERAIGAIRSGIVDTERFFHTQFSILDGGDAFEAALEGSTCKPVFDLSVLYSS